jgi:hypothetical protein
LVTVKQIIEGKIKFEKNKAGPHAWRNMKNV